MPYSRLLRMLASCASLTPSDTLTRYIIRFENAREYSRFLRQWNASKLPANLKACVRKLQLIHAICFKGRNLPFTRWKGVRFIERDVRIHTHTHGARDSAGRPEHIPWGVRRIRAPKAWKYATGQMVKVAVIDTGVDFNHPDLKHALAHGVNLLQRGTLPWDDNGHGTHISGTIAAAAAGSQGIWGTAPGTVIVPVKAFDRNGTAYISDIIEGIEWCMRHGIRLINMSFGMKHSSRAFREAVRNASRRGAIIVASAGNDGKRKGRLDYPAQYPAAIAVGSTARKGRIAHFSNRSGRVQLYAPGKKIMSTWLNKGYAVLSGTSMSTSHVSGAIALALSVNPQLSAKRIRKLIYKTGRPLNGKRTGGMREVDAFRLIRALVRE